MVVKDYTNKTTLVKILYCRMIDGSDGLFLLIQTPLTCIHVKYQLYIVLKILKILIL